MPVDLMTAAKKLRVRVASHYEWLPGPVGSYCVRVIKNQTIYPTCDYCMSPVFPNKPHEYCFMQTMSAFFEEPRQADEAAEHLEDDEEDVPLPDDDGNYPACTDTACSSCGSAYCRNCGFNKQYCVCGPDQELAQRRW